MSPPAPSLGQPPGAVAELPTPDLRFPAPSAFNDMALHLFPHTAHVARATAAEGEEQGQAGQGQAGQGQVSAGAAGAGQEGVLAGDGGGGAGSAME